MQQVIVDGLATDRATTSGDVMCRNKMNDTNCTRTRFLKRYAEGSGAVDIDVICEEAKSATEPFFFLNAAERLRKCVLGQFGSFILLLHI